MGINMNPLSKSKSCVVIPTEYEYDALDINLVSKYPITISGMGKVNIAIKTLEMFYKHGFNRILLLGFCGALFKHKIGDTVYPSHLIEGDYSEPNDNLINFRSGIHFFGHYKPQNANETTIISQDHFLTENPYKFIIGNPVCTDMESHAFAVTCERVGIASSIVRVVSDIVGEKSAEDFFHSCKKYAPELNAIIKDFFLCE